MSKVHYRYIAAICLSLSFSGSVAAYQGEPLQSKATVQSDSRTVSDLLATPDIIQQALDNGRIDQPTADLYLAYALAGDENLPAEYIGMGAWRGSAYVSRLRHAVIQQKLSAGDVSHQPNTQVAEIYNRVDIVLNGFCNEYNVSLPNEFDTPHFHIQYNTIGGGLSINDYANALERAWGVEIGTFAWPAPPVSTHPTAGNRIHVRVDIAKQQGLYGLTSSTGAHAGTVGDNPNTAWRETDAEASCVVLNRDYSKFQPTQALQALNATTAHEFVHVVHYGVGIDNNLRGNAGLTFAESMATMMEDEVANEANDNYNYLWPKLDICLGAYDENPYKYWVVIRAMTERFGTGAANGAEQILQDFMTVLSQGQGGRLTAFNQGFVNKGTTLANAYHDAAITLRFTKACQGDYIYPYCFKEADGYIQQKGAAKLSPNYAINGSIGALGESYSGTVQDHFSMNWVDLPLSPTPYAVTLTNQSTGGQMKVSAVCDTGQALNVFTLAQSVGGKQSGVIPSFDSSACIKAVAIVTNHRVVSESPRVCTADAYTLSVGTASNIFKTYMTLVKN